MGLMAFLQWGNPLCAVSSDLILLSHPLCLLGCLSMAVYLCSTYFQALNSRLRLSIWPANQWPNQSAASPGTESASHWLLICPWEVTECPNHLGVRVSKKPPYRAWEMPVWLTSYIFGQNIWWEAYAVTYHLPGCLLNLVILWPQPFLDLTQGNKWVLGTG